MSNTVNRLIDEADIIDLRIAFGQAVDTRRFSDRENLFTPEIEVDLSAFGIPVGPIARTDFIGIFQHSFRRTNVATFQAYSNFQVLIDGDKATMISLLLWCA
jgi:hypothetical protein